MPPEFHHPARPPGRRQRRPAHPPVDPDHELVASRPDAGRRQLEGEERAVVAAEPASVEPDVRAPVDRFEAQDPAGGPGGRRPREDVAVPAHPRAKAAIAEVARADRVRDADGAIRARAVAIAPAGVQQVAPAGTVGVERSLGQHRRAVRDRRARRERGDQRDGGGGAPLHTRSNAAGRSSMRPSRERRARAPASPRAPPRSPPHETPARHRHRPRGLRPARGRRRRPAAAGLDMVAGHDHRAGRHEAARRRPAPGQAGARARRRR